MTSAWKLTIFVLVLAASIHATRAAEFERASAFDSVDSFVAAAMAFRPASAKSDLSELFTVPELSEGKRGEPVTAKTIESCTALWSNDSAALLFAVAKPPIEATNANAGVLFLLERKDGHWRIADLLRFTATGKESGVSAELTAFAGTGYRLGEEGFPPVVTIKVSDGGRGYAYQAYASFTFKASKLQRLELK